MSQNAAEVAREFVQEVVEAMELDCQVEAGTAADGSPNVSVAGPDAGDLVGRSGDTLNALQYLATLVTQRRTGERVHLLLDADGYRGRRETSLTELANELAAEVARRGEEAELDPLNAFERRIIHNALTEHPDVMTYSEGEEPDRRVVIAPRAARQPE